MKEVESNRGEEAGGTREREEAKESGTVIGYEIGGDREGEYGEMKRQNK